MPTFLGTINVSTSGNFGQLKESKKNLQYLLGDDLERVKRPTTLPD